MEVTVNPPTVKLENDSVLRARDVVCLLDKLPQGASPSSNTLVNSTSKMKNVFVAGKGGYVAGSGYSRPLEDYELERGKIKVAEAVSSTFNLTSLLLYIQFSTCRCAFSFIHVCLPYIYPTYGMLFC
jgi:hypothetical protein